MPDDQSQMTKPRPSRIGTDHDRTALAAALRAVAAGDRAAFRHVYDSTAAKLFGVCLRILPEPAAAEDALQTAYLTIWRKAARFDGTRGSPMTWLMTVARNSAIDAARASGARRGMPIDAAAEIADPAPDQLALLGAGEDARRLAACMATLDADDAQLLRTAFFAGLTYPELASRRQLPLGTVKSRIRRALLRLRACLA